MSKIGMVEYWSIGMMSGDGVTLATFPNSIVEE
jgi:hypothetical protein